MNSPPSGLDFIPSDKSSLNSFAVMLNKMWKNLFSSLIPVFTPSGQYTPVLTANNGSFTTAIASGRYIQFGKFVFLEAAVIITTVGTGAFPIITLPVQAAAFQRQVLSCREIQAFGYSCVVDVGFPDFNHLIMAKYDGTNPAANSTTFVLSGLYEAN